MTAESLLGDWQLLRCESPLEIQPGTRMEFRGGGALDYVIPVPQGMLRVPLRWQLTGGVLSTSARDEPSEPTRVGVSHGEAGVLVFDFGGPRAFYVRAV